MKSIVQLHWEFACAWRGLHRRNGHAAIRGKVTDQQGACCPASTCPRQRKGLLREAVTGPTAVPMSAMTLGYEVSAEWRASEVRTARHVLPSAPAQVELKLEVGGLTES